jgi:AmiR/NasT family two-component response regulator
VGLVSNDATAGSEDSDVARAGGIAMERYGITEPRALAMMTRLARRHGVTLGVVAVAIIAASRRRAEEG